MSGSISTYNPISGISWDTKLSGTSISYYFYPGGQTVQTPNGDGTLNSFTTVAFNPYVMTQFQAALDSFSAVTKLTFTLSPTPQAAQLRFFLSNFPGSNEPPPAPETDELLGFAFPPGTAGVAGLAGFNSGASAWSSTAGGTLEFGGNAYTTLIHETGHLLGLAHPHDDGGGSTIFPGVTSSASGGTYDLNQGIYTMMSYRDGWTDGPASLPAQTPAYGEESTPMAFDIAALQAKYGANMNYRTGNDTYTLPDQNGTDTSYQCIWDAGGQNAIQYMGGSNAIIDLRPATLLYAPGGGGYVSYVDGIRGGYTIANGVSIQTARSGAGNDMLTANDGGCYLDAGTGANTITGGAGNDTIRSSGTDIIAAGGGMNQIALGQGAATINSAGQDLVVVGSAAALVGALTGGSDTVFGSTGALTFIGSNMGSTIVGGTASETIFGGSGGGIYGGGSAGSNVILTGTGASTVFGGGNGDLVYAQGKGQLVVAGAGNETLNGTLASGGNVFYAGSGKDLIAGGAASDVFFGGSGQATVYGGGGANLYAFRQGSAGQTVIGDFNVAAGDRLTLQSYAAGAAQSALSTASTSAAGTVLTLSDKTTITLLGVQSLQASAFV